ncbi:MAG: GspE/PulE family protein, partial [Proteobacteria bacterium]|nr:GspE/PulE family protein [Pseudomonadota bacterium]
IMSTFRLGDILKTKGLISDNQLKISLVHQKVTGELLGDIFVRLGFITSKELGQTLAEQFKIEFIDLSEYPISEDALKMIPKDIAEREEFIPIEIENGKMSIGVTNPSNIGAVDRVVNITKEYPKVFLVDPDSFHDSLESSYYFLENPIQERMDSIIKEMGKTGTVTGAQIASLTELVIMSGIREKATDVHINPSSDITNVFYRIDGVLQHRYSFQKLTHGGVVSRIKIMSQIDIAETRLPQDGSFTFPFLDKFYDIRVSTVPTIYGENVVMRILAGTGYLLSIDKLGFDSAGTEKVKDLFQKPYGIILIAGPTGSGKTTTLYSALREINLLERNVITVEDPVEYKLSFVKQTQVNEKVGYDFALAGRNFMRQDPDVMLLGEVRDEETAKIAIRASITGHLVLSTLHTNDAVTSIPRLLDLQVDKFLLSTSLLAIIAQRLVRKICRFCKIEYPLNDNEISQFKEYGILRDTGFKGKGCPKCNGTGYSGRTLIGEILTIDDEMRELIFSGAAITVLKKAALKKGMLPLREDGLKKAAEGITSLEEIIRVTG